MADKGDKAHVVVESGTGDKATREDEIWEVVDVSEGEQGHRKLKIKQGARATTASMDEEKWDEMKAAGQAFLKASDVKSPEPTPVAEVAPPAPTEPAKTPQEVGAP